MEQLGQITLHLGDCMDILRQLPDNAYDLAVVDPPYGDALPRGDDADGQADTPPHWNRFGGRFDRYNADNQQITPPRSGYGCTAADTPNTPEVATVQSLWQTSPIRPVARTGGQWASIYGKKIIGWDVAPTEEYFKELFRVTKNQIIWGANYFPNMPPTRCFLVWRKLTISEKFTMAMAEYAWTSFNGNAKVFECAPQGTQRSPRFHPTQKPVALYKWLLGNFAKPGDRILDTHLGSGSSAIAAHELGFEMLGIEIDPDYYAKARQRLIDYQLQQRLF